MEKRCSKCGEPKPRTEFLHHPDGQDGLNPACRACERAYYQRNRDRILERQRAYYAANAEQIRPKHRAHHHANKTAANERSHMWHRANLARVGAYAHVYREVHIEQIRERDRQYGQRNKAARREWFRAWRARRRDHVRAMLRAWKQANPERVRQLRAAHDTQRAARKAAGGSFTVAEWRALCVEYGNTCLACGTCGKLTPDYVIPLSRGGSNTIDNIQPLCLLCNLRKATQIIDYRPTHKKEHTNGDS